MANSYTPFHSTNSPPTRPNTPIPPATLPHIYQEKAMDFALPGTPAKRVYVPPAVPVSPPQSPGSGK